MGWCYCPCCSPSRQALFVQIAIFCQLKAAFDWKWRVEAGENNQTCTNPFCISYRLFSQKSSFWLLQRDQSSLGNLKDSFFHCIFYGVVGYQFFARSWALTEEIESLARILMRMATKKVKKGENPPSPDSFYGQLHIYWEMEDPCARFSLELLARCRFFSSCFPASWIDAAADSPPTTNS